MTGAAGGLRTALREATSGAHARLEAAMALDDPALPLPRYGRALQVLHAVRAGWEPELEALLPGSTGAHQARLRADLHALGLHPIAPAAPLGLGGAAQAWGARYVLEGSALGGRVLLRRAEALGLGADHGAAYFAGGGAETGRIWRAFLEALERQQDAPAVLDGARRAFEALAAFAGPAMAEAGACRT